MEAAIQKKVNLGEERYLCFSLNQEQFGIPLLSVKEVIAVPEITSVPHTPSHFLGIMNLRGQVISILDLRLKMGMKAEKNTETCVIICDLGDISLGVIVSSVDTVLAIGPEERGQKPDLQGIKSAEYVLGVVKRDKKLVLLLDIAKALGVEDRHAISHATKK